VSWWNAKPSSAPPRASTTRYRTRPGGFEGALPPPRPVMSHPLDLANVGARRA
jgi:hypothetical protein